MLAERLYAGKTNQCVFSCLDGSGRFVSRTGAIWGLSVSHCSWPLGCMAVAFSLVSLAWVKGVCGVGLM